MSRPRSFLLCVVLLCALLSSCAQHHQSFDLGKIDPKGEIVYIEDDVETKARYKKSSNSLETLGKILSAAFVALLFL
jgi:hypothetical protein